MHNRVVIIREASVRVVKMLADKDVNVTQRGSSAFVEYSHSGRPSRVNIPYIPDDASDTLLDAVQGFMDHEVAHILFTDYAVLLEAEKKGVAKLHNIIEDSFIERKMAAHFAGSGANLRNVGSFLLSRYTDEALAKTPDLAEGILFVPAVRSWAGQTVFSDYMADKWHYMSEVVAKLGDATKEVAKCSNSRDCLELSLKFKSLLEKPEEKPEGEPEGSEGGESGSPSGKGTKSGKGTEKESSSGGEDEIDDAPSDATDPSDEGSSGKSSGEPKGDDDASSSPEDDPGDEGEESESDPGDEESEEEDTEDTEDTEGAGGSEGAPDEEGEAVEEEEEALAPGKTKLEELEEKMGEKGFDEILSDVLSKECAEESKSSDYLVYTKELDIIEPMETNGRRGWSDHYMTDMQDAVDHLVAPLQKDLERAVAARSAASWSAGHRSGRLHQASLARLTSFGDDRVFRRKHISDSKDVAVSLLVDCSGSMTGSKIRNAAYSAYGLAAYFRNYRQQQPLKEY